MAAKHVLISALWAESCAQSDYTVHVFSKKSAEYSLDNSVRSNVPQQCFKNMFVWQDKA